MSLRVKETVYRKDILFGILALGSLLIVMGSVVVGGAYYFFSLEKIDVSQKTPEVTGYTVSKETSTSTSISSTSTTTLIRASASTTVKKYFTTTMRSTTYKVTSTSTIPVRRIPNVCTCGCGLPMDVCAIEHRSCPVSGRYY